MKHPFALIRGFWYPAAILILVVIAVFNHPENWRTAAIGAAIAIGVMLIGVFRIRWRWHRLFGKTPWMQDQVSAIIDGQGVKLSGQSFEALNYWGAISESLETGKAFMFITSESGFAFIPKRVLTSLQVNELRGIVAANARGKTKLDSNSRQL